MSEMTIPGGRAKGTPLSQAETKDIEYWVTRISGDLEKDPKKKFADRDRTWLESARAVLASRNGGAPARPAPSRAPAAAPASTALARHPAAEQSLEKLTHEPAAITQRLTALAEEYHLVTPTTTVDMLPEGFGIGVAYVVVTAGTDDVYDVGGGKVGLSGVKLQQIGAAAGVDWDPYQTGRLDDGSDPHYCHFRAVGRVSNFDGSERVLTGEVEIDAREDSPQVEEIRSKAVARESRPDYHGPKDGGERQLRELRKFLLRHAETKAKLRAIASMGVKRSYAPAQLTKPFAVARLMFDGHSSDPELRREFALMKARRAIDGRAALYGDAPRRFAAPQRAALPAFAGHAPPPPGSVQDDPDDLGGGDYATSGEAVPASEPRAADPANASLVQQSLVDDDRGGRDPSDPDSY